MAAVPPKRTFNLAKVDSWLAVLQWAWDRTYALVASTAGAALIGSLAKATGWISAYGPIAWGALGLLAFLIIYSVLIWGRSRLASSRKDRAAAMIAERAAEHSTVNPLAPDFRHQRIRLTDLYTPYGHPVEDRTFRGCDLVGPAVVWISPSTTFRRNHFHNVEYIKINANTAQLWPNKLAILRGSIENCVIVNAIVLVHEDHAVEFESTFIDPLQWMNDPIPPGEARAPPPRQGDESQKHAEILPPLP